MVAAVAVVAVVAGAGSLDILNNIETRGRGNLSACFFSHL